MAAQNKQNQLSKYEIFDETLMQISNSHISRYLLPTKGIGGKNGFKTNLTNVLLSMCQSRQGDQDSQHHSHLPIRHCLSLLPGEWEGRYPALQEPAQTHCMIPLFPALNV